MKIAIICPSPEPFQFGGIERLAYNITCSINENTDHCAELLKLQYREDNSLSILLGYYRFARLNLKNYDAVITLKYPAWIVKHHHHILYMNHKLRGLYDTYGGPRSFQSYFKNNPLKFPGIHIRKMVHILDNIALSPKRIVHYLAISNEVKSRGGYFPEGVDIEVLYEPSPIEWYPEDSLEYRYIFTASRLDPAKRIELIIKAMRYVKEDIELYVAGDGPDKRRLEDLSRPDPRIKILGHVKNSRLKELYLKSLVVPFVPYREDFGLITLEAMKCKKPVLTFTDSGGSKELVKDGKTGFIVEPSPRKLAEKINFFIEKPEKAVEFGENGFKSVSHINKKNFALSILSSLKWKEDLIKYSKTNKKIIVLLSTYTIFPHYGGGKARIYNLYKELSRFFRIFIIALSQEDDNYMFNILGKDFFEVRIPMSKTHKLIMWEYEKEVGNPVSDVSAPGLICRTPIFNSVVSEYSKIAHILVASHPYLFPLIKKYEDKLLVYESHNVEYNLKKDILSKTKTGKNLLKDVQKVEKTALTLSRAVFVTSYSESNELSALYDVDQSKMATIPNGVVIDRKDRFEYDRKNLKSKYNIKEDKVVVFLGAWHPPNLEAFIFIKDVLCGKLPHIRFLVLGSVLDQYKSIYKKEDFPENLTLSGNVTDDEKYELFAVSDIAINPMKSGSGTNLKMLDFMASELPVLSTHVGSRSLDMIPEKDYIQSELEGFKDKLGSLLEKPQELERIGKNGRELVRERYDWKLIAEKACRFLKGFFPKKSEQEFVLDLRKEDNLGMGWYPREIWEEDKIVRWTDGDSVISINNRGNCKKVVMKLMPGNYKEPVFIYINGIKAFENILQEGWNDIEINLHEIEDERLVINLISPIWSPHDATNSSDTRSLGVAVSEVSFS